MADIGSRDRFIDEVARTIKDSDGGDGGAFVFGISGKWGEGKSYFLNGLRKKLEESEKPELAVVELHPWKFAYTDDSILRELLRRVYEVRVKTHTKWSADLVGWFKTKYVISRKLNALYHDTSARTINWKNVLIVSALLVGAVFLYRFPPNFLNGLKSAIQHNKTLVTILLIPVLLGVANAVTTTQSSAKAVSTRDKFDELLDELLKDLSQDKLVVYVDDLDRLTADKALSVLDSLRTFFDKKSLIFVVASDHTVLERHLGDQLIPNGEPAEKIEEGRRFLMKIFNVYWRLPLPTKPEFENYVDDLLETEAGAYVKTTLKTDDNIAAFKDYLLYYFSNNFRNAQRLLGRVEFTFHLVATQYASADTPAENKEYFAEMLDNPLLVVRILLIEELANPLFEYIQHNPEILLRLESHANSPELDRVIEEVTKKAGISLAPTQIQFLLSFLPQKPRFKDELGDHVKAIQPYIFLSSDSSFGDIRGLSPDEFLNYLQKDTIADLKNVLHSSSTQKLNDAAEAFVASFNGQPAADTKVNLLTSYVGLTMELDSQYPAKEVLTNAIPDLDFSFVAELQPIPKLNVINTLGKIEWDVERRGKIGESLMPLLQADFDQINGLADITPLLQRYLLAFFVTHFRSYPGDAVTKIGNNLEKFSLQIVGNEVYQSLDALIGFFVSENNDAQRNFTLDIIKSIKTGFLQLSERVKIELANKNRAIFNWLSSEAKSSSDPVLSLPELVTTTLPDPSGSTNAADFMDRLSFFESIPEAKEIVWQKLMEYDRDLLSQVLFEAVIINNFLPLAPSNETANQFLEELLKRLVRRERIDSAETINWLQRVGRDKWLFANLSLKPQTTRLINERLGTQYMTEQVREQLNRIKNEFGTSE